MPCPLKVQNDFGLVQIVLDMSLKAKFRSGNMYIFGPIKNSLIQSKTIWTYWTYWIGPNQFGLIQNL